MKTLKIVVAILVGGSLWMLGLSGSQAAEKPKTGGTFVVGIHADPDTLNPVTTSEIVSRTVSGSIFSRLLYTDLEGNYQGDLAEKWTVSEDNLRIRFDLHKGAKWHDGQPVTAADVKFSLESLQKYHPRGIELKRISEMIILSDTSLEIRFPSPSISFLPFLDGEGFIIPKHIYSTSKDLTLHPADRSPVGSGPFVFKEWKRGDNILLTRNKSYYVSGEPFVDSAVFRVIPSGSSRVLALESGDVDYLADRALPEADAFRLKGNPNFVVTDRGMGSSNLTSIVFNTRRKPWNDVRVRQAFAHAIERDVMVEKATFGMGAPAYSPFSKGSWPWAYNVGLEKMYPQDLSKAAKLLGEAGYPVGPDGMRFASNITLDRADVRAGDIAEILREQLKKVGINLVLQMLDKTTMAQRVWMNFDFDLWVGPSSQGSDPSIGIERFFATEMKKPLPSSHNANEYSNPEVDKLFLLARSTLDQKKRGQHYRDVQPILMRDLPTLPLIDNPKLAAFPKKVRGVNERRFVSYHYAPCDAWFAK